MSVCKTGLYFQVLTNAQIRAVVPRKAKMKTSSYENTIARNGDYDSAKGSFLWLWLVHHVAQA